MCYERGKEGQERAPDPHQRERGPVLFLGSKELPDNCPLRQGDEEEEQLINTADQYPYRKWQLGTARHYKPSQASQKLRMGQDKGR